jgi:hypothetical protein
MEELPGPPQRFRVREFPTEDQLLAMGAQNL